MTEVLQANIFFLITGIAVIVFTLLLCVALYHLIRILKSIRRVVDRIEAGSEIIADDMAHFRAYFAEQSPIARFIRTVFGNGGRGSAPTQPKSKSTRSTSKAELKIKDED